MTKGIFISQIHEEAELALILQRALQDEFAGMVPVFMSSDEISIGAGSEFMRKIETNLRDCCGAILLVSSVSVCRLWVNFELGAIWARNMLLPPGGQDIPRIPLCHSGMVPANLPPLLGMLDASLASNAGDLRRMFLALETATGRRPSGLRTDFAKLAGEIASFERPYSETRKVKEIIRLGDIDLDQVRLKLNQRPKQMFILAGCIVESHEVGNMRAVLRSMGGIMKSQERGQESRFIMGEDGARSRAGTGFVVEFPRRLVECYSS